MQSYSSTVDGKTLIRVGGGHGSKPSAKTLQSNVTSNTAKIDHGLSMTSSRHPSSSSSVNITSSTISIGEAMVPSARSTSGSVTVKTATSSLSSAVPPQKKMTSIIDTKSGVVTSTFAMLDPTTSSSPAAMTSPRVASRNVGDVAMTLPNRSSASNASAKSTSVLMTSTTIPYTSRDAGGTSVLMTSSIPRSSPVDVRPSYATLMTSIAPKMTSSVLTTLPSTPPVAMAMPSDDSSMKVVVAEVHEPLTSVNSEDLGHDLEDRLSSVSMPYPAESSRSKFKTPSESHVDEDAGSLLFTDEIDSQVSAENRNIADDRVELSLPVATEEGSLPVCNKTLSDLDSNPLSSPPLSSPSPSPPSLNPPLDQPIYVPRSFDGSLCGETHPEEETNALTGSESAQLDEPETMRASTFNFIGWDVGNMADKMADRKCHRVLIFKDSEIVLMFKASCLSEEAGNDGRLRSLMVDIAVNCAKRLKKMKDVSLPKLEAEHMDSLPLTDERQTRVHLDEISRELNENVTINDVAFRFQTTEDDTYIGTYVDRCNDAVQSTTEKTNNCLIGRCGAIVVLKKKSRFATVESFSDQLCRHILSARPLSLGQISDLEVRRLSSTKTRLGPDKRQLLLFQDFLSDPSIIVAEAARRSFLKIQDFLLFE